MNNFEFKTNILYGMQLRKMIKAKTKPEKRDCYAKLNNYIENNEFEKIMILFGLRRTGKTTLLFQSIESLNNEDFKDCVYIKITTFDKMSDLNHDLKILAQQGIRFIFIDEITLIKDFIESAALLSDVYALQGIKIILSGTDSLGFMFAKHGELYDRAIFIHTTYIPYAEHSRLLGINDLDEYIRYGGTLVKGIEVNEENIKKYYDNEITFLNEKTTREYINTAIVDNIQNSLKNFEDGTNFRSLYELYKTNSLNSIVYKILNDKAHRTLKEIVDQIFVSKDFGKISKQLRIDKDLNKRTDILDSIEAQAIFDRMKNLLNIKEKEERAEYSEDAEKEIKEYLYQLDLMDDIDINTLLLRTNTRVNPYKENLIKQAGMNYVLSETLLSVLMQDSEIQKQSNQIKNNIKNKILGRSKLACWCW